MSKIVTENGKDYLETSIAKLSNCAIDASQFFKDIQDEINNILKIYNKKHKTSYTYIDRKQYGGNLQAYINRFSATFISPSFLKNYTTNPALCLVNSLFTIEKNDAAAIGTTVHSILEEYYNLPKEERDRSKIKEIANNIVEPGQDRLLIDKYLNGFITSKDYKNNKELNDKTLECKTEHRGNRKLYIRSLDYELPLKVAYVVDRIDFRDDGVYIIDYKTGRPRSSAVTFDGYLGSMLLYKWAMENEFNTDVKGGYLLCPGNKDKFMKLDFSIENEKKLVEMIDKFYLRFKKDTKRRVYEFTNKGYFNTEDTKKFREFMNDHNIWMSEMPVRVYIGETKDRDN